MNSKVVIYSKGMVYCSVCADKSLSFKEVEEEVNLQNPTGIDSQWKISKDKFKDGGENPHPCEKDKYRLHYLLSC